jgi:hypothetical protein
MYRIQNLFKRKALARLFTFSSVLFSSLSKQSVGVHGWWVGSEGVRSLRFTIIVNLEILNDELQELSAIAAQSAASEDVEQACTLLGAAQEIADGADIALSATSRDKLGDLLAEVFQAMNNAHTARRLLKACRPYGDQ